MKVIITSLLLLLLSLSHATPVIDEQYTTYNIEGANSAELRKQMNQLGPTVNGQHFDARVHWYISWHYSWSKNPNDEHCYVGQVDVKAQIIHIMPKWTNQESASSNIQDKWTHYLDNLSTHEEGHANNGKQAATEIETALLQTPEMDNCTLLQNALDSTANAIIKTHNQWDVDYDANTQHGKTQGAVFP